MRAFARLYQDLDQTTKTTRKVELLTRYFASVESSEAAWAIYFFCGEKLRSVLKLKDLREWAARKARVDDWLFDECYDVVGDLAETISLLLPPPTKSNTIPLDEWVVHRVDSLRKSDDEARWDILDAYCDELGTHERFVFFKLLTGGLRVGVSRGLVIQSVSRFSGLETDVIAHRLMGTLKPSIEFFDNLINPNTQDTDLGRPYPFYLANAIDFEIANLGDVSEWCVEWKWDGIRSQFIIRDGMTAVWSRGEEIISEQFPELLSVASDLPSGTVLDGEIVAYKDSRVLPFTELQRRLNRKKVGKKLLEEVPVKFVAFDLLEDNGQDIRDRSLAERRARLSGIVDRAPIVSGAQCPILLSSALEPATWDALSVLRQQSREQSVEGLMLKKWSGAYRVGRPRGEWWKWKVAPLTVDAVLIYAQRGHGRRANLYTDYTFAVWDGDQLVPFAKAYSGLSDAEIRQVDSYVRANTIERFGPVRSVTPELVFELAFENIQESSRHKSGIAVRFPRIIRRREDLTVRDADSLEMIRRMMVHS